MGTCCSKSSTKDVKRKHKVHAVVNKLTTESSIHSPFHSGGGDFDDDDMSYYSALDDSHTEEYKRKEKLEEFQKLIPDSSKMDLLAFLKFRDYNLEEAELQYRNTLAFRKNAPKPTIIDVAPFMMVSIYYVDKLFPLFIYLSSSMIDSDW